MTTTRLLDDYGRTSRHHAKAWSDVMAAGDSKEDDVRTTTWARDVDKNKHPRSTLGKTDRGCDVSRNSREGLPSTSPCWYPAG